MSIATRTSINPAVTLSVLLAWVLWTYAIPEIRIPATRSLPIPYLIAAPLALAVLVQLLRDHTRPGLRDAWPFLVGPALISLGTLAGYLLHRGEASWDAAWRLIFLPWMIPLLVLGLARGGVERAWRGLVIGFLVLLAYGAYGFVTGRVGDPGEHTLKYFGIHYTPSTRNADALYLLVLFFHLLLPTISAGGPTPSLWIGLSGLAGAAVVLTQSRNAWLALIIGLLVATITAARIGRWDRSARRRMLAVFVIALLVVGTVDYWRKVGILLFRRAANVMVGDPGGSLKDRIKLATFALKTAAAHPLLGIGPGTVRARIAASEIHLDQVAANHVEVAFLQVWLDAGLLGAIGLLLLWLRLLYRPPADSLRGADQVRYWCVQGLAAGLTVYMFFNVIFDNLAFWTIVGMIAAYQVHYAEVRE